MRGIKLKNKFDEIFKIMEESFPTNEIRTYQEQKELLNKKNYKIITHYSGNQIVAFIAVWDLKDFKFIEHLATTVKSRGKGIGSELVSNFILSGNKPIILEVEPPKDEITKRRINFYERLEFKYNDYYYEQPKLREDTLPCELKIMSYPNKLLPNEFEKVTNELYSQVYNKIKSF